MRNLTTKLTGGNVAQRNCRPSAAPCYARLVSEREEDFDNCKYYIRIYLLFFQDIHRQATKVSLNSFFYWLPTLKNISHLRQASQCVNMQRFQIEKIINLVDFVLRICYKVFVSEDIYIA